MNEAAPSVRVHRGRVVVDVGGGDLRISQSPFRHMHWTGWLATALLLGMSAAEALTAWQPVRTHPWPVIVFVALMLPALSYGPVVVRRLRGNTPRSRIPLRTVEGAHLTTRSVRWWMKQRRTVPLLVLTYREGGTRHARRVRFDPRFDADDVTGAVATLSAAGVEMTVDESVPEAVATFG